MADDNVFKFARGLTEVIGISTLEIWGAFIGGVIVLSLKDGRERKKLGYPEQIRFNSYELARLLQDKCRNE